MTRLSPLGRLLFVGVATGGSVAVSVDCFPIPDPVVHSLYFLTQVNGDAALGYRQLRIDSGEAGLRTLDADTLLFYTNEGRYWHISTITTHGVTDTTTERVVIGPIPYERVSGSTELRLFRLNYSVEPVSFGFDDVNGWIGLSGRAFLFYVGR